MKLIKKLLGIDKIQESLVQAQKALEEAEIRKQQAEESAKLAQEQEELANGFFELDWNEFFVLQLKQDGYGADGDKDEEIVDRWFRELCANVVVDGDFGGPVNTGVIDIQSVKKKNQ